MQTMKFSNECLEPRTFAQSIFYKHHDSMHLGFCLFVWIDGFDVGAVAQNRYEIVNIPFMTMDFSGYVCLTLKFVLII